MMLVVELFEDVPEGIIPGVNLRRSRTGAGDACRSLWALRNRPRN